MSKRQRLQVNQYARPTAADVTCVADASIQSGVNSIVYVSGDSHGRTTRGRVSIRAKDRAAAAPGAPLGVLVKTPAHEGAVDRLGGRLRDKRPNPQRQPDSIVAMTGLVTVTLKSESTTIAKARTELDEDYDFTPLILDKPRRQSATILMYDTGAAVDTDLTTHKRLDRTFPRRHTANPFDVNLKVALNKDIRLGDIVVAEMVDGALKSTSAVLEVCSIYDKPANCIVIGVAMSESVRPVEDEKPHQSGRRRYIPVRVGGTVSINDSWRCFFPSTKISDIETGSKYKQRTAAGLGTKEVLLRGSLECFIQPLQIHSVAGFHARVGRVATE